jgi:threonine aldolase
MIKSVQQKDRSDDSEAVEGPQDRMLRVMREAHRALDKPSKSSSLEESLRSLIEHGPTVYDLSAPTDMYGDTIVSDLERRVAETLGKEDAAYFPTGTMAQQVALRCWAERTRNNRVALHTLSHPEVFEKNAFQRVSSLESVRLTGAPRHITAQEVLNCPEPFGALMLELPLRDAGYVLPSWSDLVEVTQAARERGAVVHFDGARLWECTSHFGRPLDEISSLADTVYVSFYKSLKGLSGAAVAGPRQLIEEARLWRHRYGGRIFQQFPAVLSGLVGLDRELPQLPSYVAQAQMVASSMADAFRETDLGWFKVLPELPHIHEFQVWLPFDAEALTLAAVEQADESGVALFQSPWWEPGLPPGIAITDVTVSAAGLAWSAADVRDAVHDFVSRIKR